jgi:hypothetical protein
MMKLIRRFTKSSHLSYEETLWRVLEHAKLNKKRLLSNDQQKKPSWYGDEDVLEHVLNACSGEMSMVDQ